jgi:hypothetical protein
MRSLFFCGKNLLKKTKLFRIAARILRLWREPRFPDVNAKAPRRKTATPPTKVHKKKHGWQCNCVLATILLTSQNKGKKDE